MKASIFRISGSIPSANYIQFPKTKTPPLNLTGHFVYILFKPVVGKFFSIHLDLTTADDLVIRISLSNIFKEFKLTSTWLQFPVLSNPPHGSVEEATANSVNIEGWKYVYDAVFNLFVLIFKVTSLLHHDFYSTRI